MVGKFRKQMYVSLNRFKKDVLDQIWADILNTEDELSKLKEQKAEEGIIRKYQEKIRNEEEILDNLDDCFFRGMDMMISSRKYLEEHSKIVNECLISYMQGICSRLSELLEESLKKIKKFPSRKESKELSHMVRVHFRGYDAKNEEYDAYEQLCLGDSSEWVSYRMKSQEWGELLEEAYKVKHSLVASINQRYCCKSFEINQKKEKKESKWFDFMTYIPDFRENDYIVYDTKTDEIVKQRPWITFGITVYDKESSQMLYILDYLKIGQIITECFKEFKLYMPINMEEFVKERLNEKWE